MPVIIPPGFSSFLPPDLTTRGLYAMVGLCVWPEHQVDVGVLDGDHKPSRGRSTAVANGGNAAQTVSGCPGRRRRRASLAAAASSAAKFASQPGALASLTGARAHIPAM